MTLYVSDRKGFLNRRSGGPKSTAVLLASLGFALAVINLFWEVLFLSLIVGGGSTSWEARIIVAPILAFFGLVSLFGWLLFFDGLGAPFIFNIWAHPLPSKQEIDFEEAWKEYPKDLLDRYVRQYPHNPEGVLEWHIHKKMKEGKTREQAIRELMQALPYS